MVKLSSQLYSESTGGQKVAEDMSDRWIKNLCKLSFSTPPSPSAYSLLPPPPKKEKRTSGVS